MNNKQSGFTLIEIAIVLVIIGLLLGGVLKGQELINSAKVKNMATDFRNIPLLFYGYQDKYKALPGDHAKVVDVLSAATAATTPITSAGVACAPVAPVVACQGNGVIDGVWDSTGATSETELFWQHVRLAGLGSGPTSPTDAAYFPTNADGGRIGIESGAAATGGSYIQNGTISGTGPTTTIAPQATVSYFSPTYLVCSRGILGKYAKQLDSTMDDGEGATGSIRVVPVNHVRQGLPVPTALINDSASYTVCMGL